MLFDCDGPDNSWLKDDVFDICICGAGPAGITLARSLANKGRRVALMEAGAMEPSTESQSHYDGANIGLPYFPLDTCRLRFFGGTSNHWGGYTRPLDSTSFEPLPHHPMREWPIRKTDLDPFAEQAAIILDLPDPPPIPEDRFEGKEPSLQATAYRLSPPTRFGEKYRQEIVASDQISLYLNASVVDIELDANLRSVSRFLFRSYLRNEPFAIRARNFAICSGALENARILLNARSQMPQGVGNGYDLVGRFFSEHLEIIVGHAIIDSLPLDSSIYKASRKLLIEQGCLPYLAELHPLAPNDARGKSYVDQALCALPFSERLGRAILGRTPACYDAKAVVLTEQAVNSESRVTVSEKIDKFGLRQPVLDWRLTDLDYHTISTAALQMGSAMARHNIGRLQLFPFLNKSALPNRFPDMGPTYHHMCTTRMSDNPTAGVVDRNCRVHGLENLYIGGSSVFASGAGAFPTYTIVQLALRLGEHLGTQTH